MFYTLETITTKTTIKIICNKLLLLSLIIYILPPSHGLKQPSQAQSTTPSSSSSPAGATDNLMEKLNFELIFENFTCLLNDKWEANTKLKHSTLAADRMQIMEELSCSLTKNVRRRNLQMEMIFKRQVNQFNFYVVIVLLRPHHVRQPKFVLMNLTSSNGCSILALKNQVALMHWTRLTLLHYSNFPQKCPLKAHYLYYVRNFKWDMQNLPSFYLDAPVMIEFVYIFDNSTKVAGFIQAKLKLKSNKKLSVS